MFFNVSLCFSCGGSMCELGPKKIHGLPGQLNFAVSARFPLCIASHGCMYSYLEFQYYQFCYRKCSSKNINPCRKFCSSPCSSIKFKPFTVVIEYICHCHRFIPSFVFCWRNFINHYIFFLYATLKSSR